MNLERRLIKNQSSYQDYDMFLQELSHRPVYKTSSSGTKVQVVFNGSAVTRSGKSLNDLLLCGSKSQKPPSGLLIKCRHHVVALLADIRMMYRQILLSPSDRLCQYILWRKPNCDEILE